MPNTTPINVTASMRRHIAQALSVSPLALASLPEPIRQRMLDEAEHSKMTTNAEHFCARDGHHLIPDTDNLFVCRICTKRFRLVQDI